MVDEANAVWRWRPKDEEGNGTTTTVRVANAASWGDDVRAIGTFLRLSAGLYNLYVVDPSAQQIIYYFPAQDGSGFPADPVDRLAVARDVSKVDDLYIDGDIFITDDGDDRPVRRRSGRRLGGRPAAGHALAQGPRSTRLMTSGTDKRTGVLYAYDPANARVVAIDKAKGTYIEQYRLAGGVRGWEDLRGMYVIAGRGG